jgi:AraC family transcriptional regulator
MDQASYRTFADYYRDSAYGQFVQDNRVLQERPVSCTVVKQPRGTYPDPPLPFMTVGVFRRANTKLTGEVGAGPIRGRVGRGAIVVTPVNAATNMALDGPHTVLICSVPPRTVYDLLPHWSPRQLDFGRLHSTVFYDNLVEQLCLSLWSEAGSVSGNSRLLVDGTLLRLLGCLQEQARGKRLSARTARQEHPAYWRIRRAAEYLRAHASCDTTLAEAAAVAGLSPHHFTRQFKQVCGVPPHRYVLLCRIERARELLANTRVSILTMALDLGFCTPEHFAHTFRRLVGVSPRQYRSESAGRKSCGMTDTAAD